ncbi:MAG: phosphate ABC transporter permease PstA [Dethiobacter sp.]|jgi:phosphate transport system permease protein|nr:phosphate ABC transporter permease PstA [Dethiobacter sp.]MBS3988594.1 phosphate ABC transporter permease PstA [Dethiobacter sp.]
MRKLQLFSAHGGLETDDLRRKGHPSLVEGIAFALLRLSMLLVIAAIFFIFFDIFSKGIGIISWEFITAMPRRGMTEGGIWPAVLGTVYITLITAAASVPVGVFAAIYLNEYARKNIFTRIIRLSIRNLAGVPSIVYGLFGVALFVRALELGTSLLSAGLTLGLLTLPVTITASEEALKAVPDSFREGALALGATKWQAIRTNVIPSALPGIITGMILGISRAAGETAPILFTGAAFYLASLPSSLSSRFMALPYHLFIMSTQHHSIEKVRPIAYGTALVLIGLVVTMNMSAIILRAHYRKKMRG